MEELKLHDRCCDQEQCVVLRKTCDRAQREEGGNFKFKAVQVKLVKRVQFDPNRLSCRSVNLTRKSGRQATFHTETYAGLCSRAALHRAPLPVRHVPGRRQVGTLSRPPCICNLHPLIDAVWHARSASWLVSHGFRRIRGRRRWASSMTSSRRSSSSPGQTTLSDLFPPQKAT